MFLYDTQIKAIYYVKPATSLMIVIWSTGGRIQMQTQTKTYLEASFIKKWKVNKR